MAHKPLKMPARERGEVVPSPGQAVVSRDGALQGTVRRVCYADVGMSSPAIDIEIVVGGNVPLAMSPERFRRHWRIERHHGP